MQIFYQQFGLSQVSEYRIYCLHCCKWEWIFVMILVTFLCHLMVLAPGASPTWAKTMMGTLICKYILKISCPYSFLMLFNFLQVIFAPCHVDVQQLIFSHHWVPFCAPLPSIIVKFPPSLCIFYTFGLGNWNIQSTEPVISLAFSITKTFLIQDTATLLKRSSAPSTSMLPLTIIILLVLMFGLWMSHRSGNTHS